MLRAYIITGPTSVGKSDCALELAQRINGEIINADSGQFYVPLTIGTAKPELKNQVVPHHLFDLFDEPKSFSAVTYRSAVISCIEEIVGRGRVPIIVGGSGFYIQQLFFAPPLPNAQHGKISLDFLSTEEAWRELSAVDPERSAMLHPNDRYRILRALELWRSTGILPSKQRFLYDPIADFTMLACVREREDLNGRIAHRTAAMLAAGWIDEVRALDSAWRSFVRAKKLIGYPEILGRLPNGSLEGLSEEIVCATRRYAKRQMTWLRSSERMLRVPIRTINLTLSSFDLYLEQWKNGFM